MPLWEREEVQAVRPGDRFACFAVQSREENWSEHFTWIDDYTSIEGVTPTGRATAAALKLNREGLVNMRRVLYAIGEHPPAEPAAVRASE